MDLPDKDNDRFCNEAAETAEHWLCECVTLNCLNCKRHEFLEEINLTSNDVIS